MSAAGLLAAAQAERAAARDRGDRAGYLEAAARCGALAPAAEAERRAARQGNNLHLYNAAHAAVCQLYSTDPKPVGHWFASVGEELGARAIALYLVAEVLESGDMPS